MEFWLIFAYVLGTGIGCLIGGRIAYRVALQRAVPQTIDFLISAGYLRVHPPRLDGSQELIKFDEQ